MDPMTELDGAWFEEGERLAEAEAVVYEDAPPPSRWTRLAIAAGAAAALVAGLLGVARVLA